MCCHRSPGLVEGSHQDSCRSLLVTGVWNEECMYIRSPPAPVSWNSAEGSNKRRVFLKKLEDKKILVDDGVKGGF